MKELKQLVDQHKAKTRPADAESIQALEKKLGFLLSTEYRKFLSLFGVIVFKSNETYGLGVPEDYYLNVLNSYSDLSRDTSYPHFSVPLLEVGDGQYYLYNCNTQKVLLWATPNGGVVRTLDLGLEQFLIKQFFA
jgi:hypothetical protein